jgi:hypothetical protein
MASSLGFSSEDADEVVEVSNAGARASGRGRRNKWSGVRGRPGVIGGAYQFEIVLEEICLLRVGWAADAASRIIGLDGLSFGYGGTALKSHNYHFDKYGEEYDATGTVLTCCLDRRDPLRETISYYLNGRCLGEAFQLPADLAGVPLFPAVSGKESWCATLKCSDLSFPQVDFRLLGDGVALGDAVVGPLVLGFCASDADAFVEVSADGLHVSCKPESDRSAWFGVRGRPGVLRGRYCFEVALENACLIRVGWATLRTRRALGNDDASFGYGGTGKKSNAGQYSEYGDKFQGRSGAVISCLIDRSDPARQTISYALDGSDLGIAFELSESLAEEPIFPAICGKGEWRVACRYTAFAFPLAEYRPLSEALGARDAVPGHGLPGAVVPPTGRRVARNPLAELEKLAQATCVPVDGVVPGRRVVLHVHSGPWQGWYTCEVVEVDPMGCYLLHESDGYKENVPWGFLNAGKYSMEILPEEVLTSSDAAAVAPAGGYATLDAGEHNHKSYPASAAHAGDADGLAQLFCVGRLRVHADLGAGMTLQVSDLGYFVQKLEEPGQPDIKMGDVILAIGTEALLGLEEDEVEKLFGDAFGPDAPVVVGNYMKLRQRSFRELRGACQQLLRQPPPPLSQPLATAQPRQAAALPRTSSTKSGTGAGGLLRRGRLRVDFRSGTCGLEMSACEAGYFVDLVDPVPGQADLEAGDVIVAIGGSTLYDLDEDSVAQCFGDAYCDGAIIVAGPLEQLKTWSFEVVRQEIQRLIADEAKLAGRSGLLERARTY